MNLVAIARFPIQRDLALLDQILTHRKIPHRFTEEAGFQVLWIEQDISKLEIEEAMAEFESFGTDHKVKAVSYTHLTLPTKA